MFEKLKKSKLMFWSLEILILATLIFVATKISFIFDPIATFFSTLFAPILIAGFLFYALNPLVNFLMKKAKLSRNLSIALIFVVLLVALVLIVGQVIPSLIEQIAQLASNLPSFISTVESWVNDLLKHPMLKDVDLNQYLSKMDISFGNIIKQFVGGLSSGVSSFIGVLANATMVIVTVPLILFYMLKDGHKLLPGIQKFLPEKHGQEMIGLMRKMSDTISSYISGQAFECLFVGTFTFLGYLIVGVDYAFLFGCIAGATNMIPYLGPYLGLAPAVMVTIFDSPWRALLACIVVLVVQQVDSNIIYPNVIGRSLSIHPLTIILILLVAGNIAGLLGMVLGVPFYAVCRTIVLYIYDIYRLNKTGQQDNKQEENPVSLASEESTKEEV